MHETVGGMRNMRQDHLDRKCFPCHLFQECPDALRPRQEKDADDNETDEASHESSDEDTNATEQRRGKLLKDVFECIYRKNVRRFTRVPSRST